MCFRIYMICDFWNVLYFSCYFSNTYGERITSFLLSRCFSDFLKSRDMSAIPKIHCDVNAKNSVEKEWSKEAVGLDSALLKTATIWGSSNRTKYYEKGKKNLEVKSSSNDNVFFWLGLASHSWELATPFY